MPSSAASSMSPIKRPVLPLPVMPTQTAWVVNRLRVDEQRLSEPGWPVAGSTFRPR